MLDVSDKNLTKEQVSKKLAWFDELSEFHRRANSYGEMCEHEAVLLEKARKEFLKKYQNANKSVVR